MFELGFATWRLSRMLVREAGPHNVFADLRAATGIEYNEDGTPLSWPDWSPLHCEACTSLYVSVLLMLAPSWLMRVLAVSGMAVAINEIFRVCYDKDARS